MSYSDKDLMKAGAHLFFPGLLGDRVEDVKAEARKQNARRVKKGLKLIKVETWDETDSGLLVPQQQEIEVPDSYSENEEFDMLKFMRASEDPVTGTLRDLRVDDRDLKLAKNYWDFSYNVIGKGGGHPPWAKQMWTGLVLNGEVCPCCSNPKWLDIHNVPKDYPTKDIQEHLVLLENGVCPKCKREKRELVKDYNLYNYTQLVNVLGQRSGKSSSAAGMMAYDTHRRLKFPNLATMTKYMQASTELTFTMVSLTFGKAVGVMWTPYRNLIEEAQWFKDYRKMLDHYGSKAGRELYKMNAMFHTYAHKNMRYYPSGPKSSTLRGDTRMGAGLDELGLFPEPKGDSEEDETSERANADEAHKSLMNSLATVQAVAVDLLFKGFNTVPNAILYCVSSPVSLRDKVMRLYRESKTDVGRMYSLGINLPTWEVNPSMEKTSPIIAMAYNSNPEKAERDFGANPPQVHSVFIPKATVEHNVFTGLNSTHTIQYQYDKPGELYARAQRFRSPKWPGIVTMDAGLVNNSFTICGFHFDFETHKTVNSTVIEIMPHEGRRINFNLVYLNVILPIMRDLRAVALIADRWNSVDLLNRAEMDMGNNELGKPALKSKQFTPRRRHFDSVVTLMQNQNIVCPKLSDADHHHVFEKGVDNYREEMVGKPVPHLALQMITVKDMGEGRCPDKGEGYTDDIFRSFVLGGALIHEPKIMQRLIEAKEFKEKGASAMPRPIYRSRGG